MTEVELQIRGFLDADGRLTGYPVKRKKKLCALAYLAGKFTPGRRYTERELNEALGEWHTFEDPATLRRELYDNRFLDREGNGSAYWLEEPQPQLQTLLDGVG